MANYITRAAWACEFDLGRFILISLAQRSIIIITRMAWK